MSIIYIYFVIMLYIESQSLYMNGHNGRADPKFTVPILLVVLLLNLNKLKSVTF